jgi:hypothetical protein
MTSQLNVDTIVDKAGSGGSNVKMANTSTYVGEGGSSTQNTVQGLAKAWLFGSSSAALQDSFNISTPTDHGTGDYSYTLTNPFSNDDYSLTATANSTDQRRNATENGARSLAGTLAIETSDAGTMDNTAHNITAHGDLA